jgi:hypothetical protein
MRGRTNQVPSAKYQQGKHKDQLAFLLVIVFAYNLDRFQLNLPDSMGFFKSRFSADVMS